MSEAQANAVSVRLELRPTCRRVGPHAQQMRQILEQGHRGGAEIGDDVLQRQSTGNGAPGAFTHGQRCSSVNWFRGTQSGDLKECVRDAAALS